MMPKIVPTLLLLVMAATPAHAACNAAFESIEETPGTVDLDPFDPSPFQRTLRVTVRNEGSDACRLGISAIDRSLGTRQLTNTQIPFELVWNNLPIPNVETPIAGRELTLAAGEAREIYISVQVRRPVQSRPISTEAVFTLRLHDFDQSVDIVAERDARLPVNISATAQINIAGSSSSFGSSYGIDTIDFGTLEAGKIQRVYVQLRGNVAMRMTVQSANAGVLRHETIANAAGIPYTVDLQGQTFSPSTSRSLHGLLSTGASGTNIPMTLSITEVGDVPAGQYSDVLTLSIEPE